MMNCLKPLSAILFTSFIHSGIAQYGDLGIKEKFDDVYSEFYIPKWENVWNANQMYDSNNKKHSATRIYYQDMLGSTLSGSLDALLVMYEATCDIEYLYEFMRRSTQVQMSRADVITPQFSGSPYWFIDQIPWHGRILTSQAHFVLLVQEYGLENIIIPTDPNNSNEFGGKSTFGEFSDWLNQSNMEVMDFLLPKYWRDNNECFCKPLSWDDGCPSTSIPAINKNCYYHICSFGNTEIKSISELNYQGAYGTAILYMYLANPTRTDYGVKAVEMARAYLIEHGGIFTSGIYNNYVWYHDGWQQTRTGSNPWQLETNNGIEDIGHAYFDISFPILYNRYYSDITGTITGNTYFEDYQLVRFKNTFSKLIYNWEATDVYQTYVDQNTFSNFVDGTLNTADQYKYQSAAKMWTDLYKFDAHPNAQGDNIYDIMMNFYDNVERYYPAVDGNFGGARIKGLADLCAANYYMEGLAPSMCNFSSRFGVSSNNEPGEVEVVLVPNPVASIFDIRITGLKHYVEAEVEVKIISVEGIIMYKGHKTENIDVSSFPKGLYFIEISTPEANLNERLIIN